MTHSGKQILPNFAASFTLIFFFASAATSLISAVYSLLRSLIAMALLYGFCFGALKVQHGDDANWSRMWPWSGRRDDRCVSVAAGAVG